jgi:hypothetical protein
MPEPISMKLGMYITAPEPNFIVPSHQSVCRYVYLPIVVRLCRNVTAANNTQATTAEFRNTGVFDFSIVRYSIKHNVWELDLFPSSGE